MFEDFSERSYLLYEYSPLAFFKRRSFIKELAKFTTDAIRILGKESVLVSAPDYMIKPILLVEAICRGQQDPYNPFSLPLFFINSANHGWHSGYYPGRAKRIRSFKDIKKNFGFALPKDRESLYRKVLGELKYCVPGQETLGGCGLFKRF